MGGSNTVGTSRRLVLSGAGENASRACTPLSLAGNLDVGIVWYSLQPHHDRQASHAFATDDANLNARLAPPVGNHGGKSRLNEIDMIDASIAALQGAMDWKINRLQVRLEQTQIGWR
jgi:hypothetical protein